MRDQELIEQISRLVDEEHRLLELAGEGKAPPDEHERLQALQVALDQCWDLLRQRRGRRDAGASPETAHTRDPKTVEGYEQ